MLTVLHEYLFSFVVYFIVIESGEHLNKFPNTFFYNCFRIDIKFTHKFNIIYFFINILFISHIFHLIIILIIFKIWIFWTILKIIFLIYNNILLIINYPHFWGWPVGNKSLTIYKIFQLVRLLFPTGQTQKWGYLMRSRILIIIEFKSNNNLLLFPIELKYYPDADNNTNLSNLV